MNEIQIREIKNDRKHICNNLLRSLPMWFGIESAIQKYCDDVEKMTTLAAFTADHQPIGFLSLNHHSEWTSEIHVMAIHPDYHRQGIGKKLLQAAETLLRTSKFEFISVKTISPTRSNQAYDLTRKFYFAMGFRTVEEFKTLWGESNPCLLLIKKLQ